MQMIPVGPAEKRRAVSRKKDPSQVAATLVQELGEMLAHKRALREQQDARRARSRKRFAFWVAVASEIAAPSNPNS